LYYLDNIKELMYQKLYYAINWSKKYDFELKDDINILNINNDINMNILYNINKKLLYDKIYKSRIKLKDHIIKRDMFYNKIIKLYNKHK
jgi:predicted nucleotidyltransferase